MKALILISLLSFGGSAQAQMLDFADCEIAAAKVVKQMVLGTSKAKDRAPIRVTVSEGFDDNSDLVYEVETVEKVNMGHMDIIDTNHFKVIAKGSEDRCEILSVNRFTKN